MADIHWLAPPEPDAVRNAQTVATEPPRCETPPSSILRLTLRRLDFARFATRVGCGAEPLTRSPVRAGRVASSRPRKLNRRAYFLFGPP